MSEKAQNTSQISIPPIESYSDDVLLAEQSDGEPELGFISSSDKRRRGEHSTKCLCPNPFWSRSRDFKRLPGQLGKAYNRLVKVDKEGKPSLRIRYSLNPIFVHLREAAGRKRRMRPERRNLLDAMAVLLIANFDLTHSVVWLNVSQLANQLSLKDERGAVIEKVTESRVSRLLDELKNFNLVYPSEEQQWDKESRQWFPKHIYLTDLFWQTLNILPEKIVREGEKRRQAEYEGICMPGEIISVSRAREQFNQKIRSKTLKLRRVKAAENKVNKRLEALPFDERISEIAEYYRKKLPKSSLNQLTISEFTQRCHSELNRRGLSLSKAGSDDPPIH